jgi:anaerobic magnesium-protoporphyrin IX monomethyl ester cyclase
VRFALVSYDTFQGRSTGLYPPLHLCNLATNLELAGYEARVFDYAGEFSKIDEFFREIAEFSPDAVGLTCYTPYLKRFNQQTAALRKFVPKAVMVVGGGHPSVWPSETLEQMPHIDYAMQGECDQAIVGFAQMLQGNRQEHEVPGLVFRKNGEIRVNPRDTIITDLDQLPQINRGFLDRYYRQRMYWDMAAKGRLDMMISSRGCPYDCSFCFKVERSYRFRSVDHVMAEFEELRRRGVRSIHIQDDAFTVYKKRCMAITEELIKGRYGFDLKVRSRVNTIDESLLRQLKKAGVRQIIYGFESGSQAVLDCMNKKTTVAMNRRAVELTKKVGIACYGEIMIGMPAETRETINQTIDFLLETKPIIGHVAVLYPLPGTQVYDDAKRDGTLLGDWSVSADWPWVRLPWVQSCDELYAEASRINRAVQRDPGTILYFLKCHARTMSWRQIKFLGGIAKGHLFGAH